MDQIIEEPAKFIPNLPGIESILRFLRCAETDDGRQWTAKTTEWPRSGCRNYPLRVGVEPVYYALAQHNNLPMPHARVLKIGGELCWGTHVLADRTALVKPHEKLTAERHEEVRLGLLDSPEERDAFLRMIFLDVFLLNADRTPGNVLLQRDGAKIHLFSIDHEQSLGWRNNTEGPEKNRILSPAEEFARMGAYIQLETQFHWGVNTSTPEQRIAAWSSLKLEPALLEKLKPSIPPCLFPNKEFEQRKIGLSNWWTFLKERPFEELNKIIFG